MTMHTDTILTKCTGAMVMLEHIQPTGSGGRFLGLHFPLFEPFEHVLAARLSLALQHVVGGDNVVLEGLDGRRVASAVLQGHQLPPHGGVFACQSKDRSFTNQPS